MSDLTTALARIVGARHVLTDPELTASYEVDWTGRFRGRARCVVRPTDTAEVAAVVRACAAAGTPLTVQGGNTGLVGGSVPAGGDVLLSTGRLTALGPVDVLAAQVTAGAGVPLTRLQEYVRPAGLDFGVDFAARDSCTVGGMAATNAGGERVLRYGGMRAHVVGYEAVLADGTVVEHLAGLPKDNTGYDLGALLVGSEGTLGVLTRLRLRLVPHHPHRTVALIAVADTASAVGVLAALRGRLDTLESAEVCYTDGVDLVRGHTGLPAPFAVAYPAFLLIECAGATGQEDAVVTALGEAGGVLDAAVASDPRGRAALWRYREAHTESINAAGVPVKLDVSVPVRALAEAVAALPKIVAAAAPGSRLIVFGHVNEGNLHVNVLDAGGYEHEATDAVLRLVAGYGGSISAEHGVGRAKVGWLPLSRSATELAAMTAVKRALDPAGLLNPDVLLPRP